MRGADGPGERAGPDRSVATPPPRVREPLDPWKKDLQMIHPDSLHDSWGDEKPERVFWLYDPPSSMRALIVIDTTAFGTSAGGVRMLADLSPGEIARMARAMTHKNMLLGLRCGGAKAGIWFDPAKQDRDAVLRAFLSAVRPLFEQLLYLPGADMGTYDSDFLPLRNAREDLPFSGLRSQSYHGLPLEDQLTGYGVVESARVAAEFFGVQLAGARVSIEGFGKVGGGAARFFSRADARVVALSTVEDTRYDPRGLDVELLLDLRREHGDAALRFYPRGELLPSAALFSLPTDILVPGARPDAIHEGNVDAIDAKLVVPGANIPFTRAIARRLHEAGVGAIPGFVANGGGVVAAVAETEGLDAEGVFREVRERIGPLTREVLERSGATQKAPYDAALELARERWREIAPGRDYAI